MVRLHREVLITACCNGLFTPKGEFMSMNDVINISMFELVCFEQQIDADRWKSFLGSDKNVADDIRFMFIGSVVYNVLATSPRNMLILYSRTDANTLLRAAKYVYTVLYMDSYYSMEMEIFKIKDKSLDLLSVG
jgi:hypothetical protein